MAKNIINIVENFWVRPKEIAEPRNGAEQGVASNTAKIPDRKFGIKIFFSCSFLLIFLLRKLVKNRSKLISKNPSKLAVKIAKIIIRKIRK